MNDVVMKILTGVSVPVLVALGVYLKKRLMNPIIAALERLHGLEQLMDDVAAIKKEVQPNGGQSMADKVNVMSDNVSLLEARQRGLLSALPRAVFETDDKFNWIDANLAMERLTGKGWANLELRRWVASIHEEDRPDVMMELHNAVEDKRGVNISFRFRTDSGVVPVSMDAIPIFSRVKPNTVICWSGSMKTDDDQRMAERRRI